MLASVSARVYFNIFPMQASALLHTCPTLNPIFLPVRPKCFILYTFTLYDVMFTPEKSMTRVARNARALINDSERKNIINNEPSVSSPLCPAISPCVVRA